jgi:hypothetical protein
MKWGWIRNIPTEIPLRGGPGVKPVRPVSKTGQTGFPEETNRR